ncbi:DUF899 family protein [Spirillospora sp. CA-108201]
MRGLHVLQRPAQGAVQPARRRDHLRHALPGPLRGERPVPRLHGLGRPLVLRPGLRRVPARRPPCRHVPPGLLPADGDRVFETYWTNGRGVEAMDIAYSLMDMTVYGRQETWEDSPEGWPREGSTDGGFARTDGRPTSQWQRLKAGRPDTLT